MLLDAAAGIPLGADRFIPYALLGILLTVVGLLLAASKREGARDANLASLTAAIDRAAPVIARVAVLDERLSNAMTECGHRHERNGEKLGDHEARIGALEVRN